MRRAIRSSSPDDIELALVAALELEPDYNGKRTLRGFANGALLSVAIWVVLVGVLFAGLGLASAGDGAPPQSIAKASALELALR